MPTCSDVTDLQRPAILADGQLTIPESTDGLTLADFVPVLTRYREINESLIFDYRDKKGNAEARSHVAKLRRIKAPINEIHKRLKAYYKAIVDKMDADKREALAVVEGMIDHHDQHLRAVAAEEAAEAARKKTEAEIADCWGMAHDMNAIHDQKREIERQAAEQAKVAAAQAEAQRKIEQAAREKEIAEKAAAEAKAAADVENTRRVHRAILAAMVARGIDEEAAKGLILAIRGREIPALSIDYQWM